MITNFFTIAITQYIFNISKFFSKDFKNTISRKIYLLLSTFLLITLLIILCPKCIADRSKVGDFMAICFILAPILIVYSLVISYSDLKLKKNEENLM